METERESINLKEVEEVVKALELATEKIKNLTNSKYKIREGKYVFEVKNNGQKAGEVALDNLPILFKLFSLAIKGPWITGELLQIDLSAVRSLADALKKNLYIKSASIPVESETGDPKMDEYLRGADARHQKILDSQSPEEQKARQKRKARNMAIRRRK